MRLPAAVLALCLALQPGASAFGQAVSAAASGAGVALGPLAIALPASALPAPATAPVGAGVGVRVEPAALLAAPAVPVALLTTIAPAAGVLATAPVPARSRGLASAADRVALRLRDAAKFGGRAAEEAPPPEPRRSGLASAFNYLTHPKAGRALRPAAEGVPPTEREKQESERARALVKVVGIGLAFAAVEAIGSWLTGSVALRADAMHLALDTSVSAAALLALWLSKRPGKRFAKAEPVIGLLSSLAIGFTAIEIGHEVYERFLSPVAVGPVTMLLALSGLAANLINAFILRKFRDDGVSMKGAFLHALTDAVGSIGIVVSGLAVYFFNWAWADAAIGGVIVALILATAVNLARASWKALRAPAPAPPAPR